MSENSTALLMYFFFQTLKKKLQQRIDWLRDRELQPSTEAGSAASSEAPASRWATGVFGPESAAVNAGFSSLSAQMKLPETLEALHTDFLVDDLTPVLESQDVTGLFARIPVHVRPTMELMKSFAWLRGSAHEVGILL